jgi:hypothetical protein
MNEQHYGKTANAPDTAIRPGVPSCSVPRKRLSGGAVAANLGLAWADQWRSPEVVYRSQAPEMTMEATPKPRWLRIVLGFLASGVTSKPASCNPGLLGFTHPGLFRQTL